MEFMNDVLLDERDHFELFNNIGYVDGMAGRLAAYLTMTTSPRLSWEFQAVSKGDYTQLIKTHHPRRIGSSGRFEFDPYFFIEHPDLAIEPPDLAFPKGDFGKIVGETNKITFGNLFKPANIFKCYFSNTDFMRTALGVDLANSKNNYEEIREREKILNNSLDEHEIIPGWHISFQIGIENTLWLSPKLENRGSRITLTIILSAKDCETRKSLFQMQDTFCDLANFLSYVNVGYLHPVCINAKDFSKSESKLEDIASLFMSGLNSPQEDLGESIITDFGLLDLVTFLKCFPRFQEMMRSTHWEEKWGLVLEWYFQVNMKLKGRRRNDILSLLEKDEQNILIATKSNVIGSLLENLARLILVQDGNMKEEDFKGRTYCRVNKLLIHMGINNEKNEVENFFLIRNNSTHAEPKSEKLKELDFDHQKRLVNKGIQWVDEAILARIGYSGRYLARSSNSSLPIQPRYTLSD